MKIIVEIEVGHWTKKNIEAFSEWLSNELDTNNMHGGDNAHVVSVKKKSTTKKKKK